MMNNPNISRTTVGFMLLCMVGCGYSPLDKNPTANELAGTYLPGHSVIVTAKKTYAAEDLRSLHITLSADQTVEAILPDGWHSPMESSGDGKVERYTGTWSVEKDSDEKHALILKAENTQTKEKKNFSLSLAKHGGQAILGLNVITEKTKWFGFSDTHIRKDIWFRRKNDKLVAYLDKNILEGASEQTESPEK
jgi:hypothetical protein